MKARFLGLCVAVLMVFGFPTLSQAGSALTLEPQAGVSIPMMDWSDAAGVGFGGLVRIEYTPLDMLGVGFSAGYLYHLEKNSVTWSEIPLMLSGKYTAPFGLFAELGLGPIIHRADSSLGGDSDTEFGMFLGAGYEFMNLTVGAKLWIPKIGDIDKLMGLVFTVGYRIGLL